MEDPQSGKSSPPPSSQRRPSHLLHVPPSKALEERIRDELILLGLFEPVEVGVASLSGCGHITLVPQNSYHAIYYSLHFVDVSMAKSCHRKSIYKHCTVSHVSLVMLDVVLCPQPKEEKEEEDEILTELMKKQAELKAVVSDLSNELGVLVMYWTK